jgi:hypothetical protein
MNDKYKDFDFKDKDLDIAKSKAHDWVSQNWKDISYLDNFYYYKDDIHTVRLFVKFKD